MSWLRRSKRAAPAPEPAPEQQLEPQPEQASAVEARQPEPEQQLEPDPQPESSSQTRHPKLESEQEQEPASAPEPRRPKLGDPATLSRDEALEALRTLRSQSPVTWTATDPAAVASSLLQLRDVAVALDLNEAVAQALSRAVEQPDDAEAMFGAGYQLIDVGIADLAVAPLTRSLEILPAHGPTLDELALALEAANRPDEAARLLLAHPLVLAQRESTRALCSHFAAMAGDVGTAVQLAEQVDPGGELGFFADRARARAARADSLAGITALDSADLRGWEAVLNGTVVLHRSDVGDEAMNGRYGALWDNADRCRQILDLLARALGAADRTPTRVVAGVDRDSQVLGWALAGVFGLPAPTPLAEATPGGVKLVALYDWDRLDRPVFDRFFHDRDAVLFAYGLNWTKQSSMAPDLAGMEAQALFPAWGQRLRAVGDPGEITVTDVPADDRDPQVIGSELAAIPAAPSASDADEVLALVRALRAVPESVAMLGGPRDRFHPDGPVRSARFQ